MAFFHAQAQAPIIQPIQPHHDHSYSASSSSPNDELDVETAALIANLALDNFGELMGSSSRKGKARADSLPSDDEIAYQRQSEQFDQWISSVADAKLAKSVDGALATDTAHMDAPIIGEDAEAEDWVAAELLSRGEALPDSQTRLEYPNFIMNLDLFTEPEMEDTQSDQAEPDASKSDVVKIYETFIVDNESMDGEQIESDSDSDQIYIPSSTTQFEHSNTVGNRSITRPHHDQSTSASASGSTINDELDVETAALIANLTLDNFADLMDNADSLPSDEAIAYLQQCEQFDQWLSIMADVKLAKSIDEALVTDAAYLDPFVTAEDAAVEDRIAAELLSRGEALPVPKSCQTRLEDPNFIMNPELIKAPEMDDTHSDQAGPYASNSDVARNYETVDNESIDGERIESDSDQIYIAFSTARSKYSNAVGKHSITGPRINRNNKRVNCVSCLESCRYSETLQSPCDHYYCRDCLVTLVETFTRDETLFPLRCCEDPIPVAEVLPTLSLALRTLFQQKNAEFSIFAGDRLYCSNPNCCSFMGSSEGRLSSSAIECPNCHVNTCPRCKEPTHPGEGCGVGALQALAMSEEWQTCPGCNTVVELNEGCNHITCRCGTQFCYLCAALWKTCGCAQ